MAHAQLGAVLRHIRKLAGAPQTQDRTDGQLLHAFAAHNDHSAFAALVRRHGPLVMGVCRQVLRHTQDAEDVFQATFLVLARKAASIRKSEALVSWLHGVAYRMAMNAKRNAARRRQHESRAKTVSPANPSWEVAWHEVQTLLNEEIQRLPEKYRAPFLLCCVENQSRAEAARQLGLKEGTVWSRLSQARKQLQERLARRGVTLSAVLGAAAVSKSVGTAAVPDLLVETTARAAALYAAGQTAAGGLISAEVAALVKGVTQTMLVTKLKIATALLLATTLMATGAGMLVRQPAAAAVPQEKEAAKPAASLTPIEATAKSQSTAAPDNTDEAVVLSGLVLDPDGKPASGAKLYLARNTFKSKADLPVIPKAFIGGPPTYLWTDDPPQMADLPLRAATGPDGRFSFTARRADLGYGALVVARAPGYGPDWAELEQLDKAGNITLRLAKDDVPIQGRVLDLEGQPIASSTVTVLRVEKPQAPSGLPALDAVKQLLDKGDIEKMVAMRKTLGATGGTPGPHLGAEVLDVPTSVKTGADGRFRLTGFGRDRLVRLRIQAPGIENTYVSVHTVRDAEVGSAKSERTYPATFDYVAGPNWPILGTVREKSTGKPLVGITVAMGFSLGDGKGGTVRTTTDAAGRYRLEGVAKTGRRHLVIAAGVPYFSSFKPIEETLGLEPLTVDFELERGLAVRGRLTDRSTGKPVRGLVGYYALSDNPHLKDFVDVGQLPLIVDGRGEVGPDGSFAVVALPGPGLLCVWADDDRFPRAVEGGDAQPQRTVPFPVNPIMFHAMVRIHPSEQAPNSTNCDIALEPGRTVIGSVVGPDGKPLTGVLATGLTAVLPAARYQSRPFEQPACQKLEADTFTMYGLNPRQPRTLVLVHPEKGLAKVQTFRGDEACPLTVRLEPVGAVSGRIVDAEGHPWEGLRLEVFLRPSPTDKTLPYEVLGRGGIFSLLQRDLFTRAATTDGDGKFRIEGLLPGLPYELQPLAKGNPIKKPLENAKPPIALPGGLFVEAGQTKDVGEIRSTTTPAKLAKE
jgi:RNA polymerase sigma factor (sigma-70 family)